MNTLNKTARVAGLLYLVYIVTSVIADVFGKFVFAEPGETVAHMLAQPAQFNTGFVISLFSAAIFILAAWALYVLFKPGGETTALLFLVLNLAGFAIWCTSLLLLYSGFVLLSRAEYLKGFTAEQLQGLATVLISMRRVGACAAQVPYGIWLFPLGLLVYRSKFLPKVMGILLIVDGCGLMIYVCQHFLFPSLDALKYPIFLTGFIAECGLALWLSIRGVKELK